MTDRFLLQEGRVVLLSEGRAVLAAARRLGRPFLETVRLIGESRGKVVLSGIGKSGLVARRMAAILSSTGTPAFFMHPTEGMHGDIGILRPEDTVILISHSGKSQELLQLVPFIKRHGVKIIAIARSAKNPLSNLADLTLTTGVNQEACPFNLVPTTSATVTAALGDALAITLLKFKGFKLSDYKNVHPGGAIGKRLLYRVEDLMVSGTRLPLIRENHTLGEAIRIMSTKKLGMVCITNAKGHVSGILTDGDLRRLLERNRAVLSLPVKEVMGRNPRTIQPGLLAVEALSIMERYAITSLVVVISQRDKTVCGVIHMHTILKAGVV